MRGLPSDVLCVLCLPRGLQEGTLVDNWLTHRKFFMIDTEVLASTGYDSETIVDNGFRS